MDDYETGYGKPPKRFQFKKGVSGNPKGWPKRKANSLASVINDVMSAQVVYRDGGREKCATRREVILELCVRRALADDMKAAAAVLALREHAEKQIDAQAQPVLIENWLSDVFGQTGEQKTRAAAQARDDLESTARPEIAERGGGAPLRRHVVRILRDLSSRES
jgi:Family of unknown function (DUF5681)